MIEFPVVLVINCGSSSVKFSVLDASSCDALMTGIADGINTEKAFISVNGGEPARLAHQDYEGALAAIALELEKRNLMSSVALIGHRIAHGGDLFSESTLITEEVIEQIRQVSPLAPLHNYANLSGVEAAERLFPGVQQVAVFDTSFQTLPPQAYLYGLPYCYFEALGVRRYGFHGTSHRYVAAQAHTLLGLSPDDSGLVIAHLGNGASICAVRNGVSVDTSMGMTPLEGLVMGTRCGDLDFGAAAYIARCTGQTIESLYKMVNNEAGLFGLSGLSSDCRTLQEARGNGDPRASLAIDVMVHRLARHLGAHLASLHRFDALIFTGGIGENSALIRELTAERLAIFGVQLDAARNAQMFAGRQGIISRPGSPIVAVIATNEERMIAEDAAALAPLLEGAA